MLGWGKCRPSGAVTGIEEPSAGRPLKPDAVTPRE